MFKNTDLIYSYTRADAIEDGVLIPVDDKLLREAGFKYPVALKADVWDLYVHWTDADNQRQTYQDEGGRWWDILWMLRGAISGSKKQAADSKIKFTLYVVPRNGRSRKARKTDLYALCHPGDQGEPVITVFLNERDD